MSVDKKWDDFDKAVKMEKELKKSAEYKIFENFLTVKRAIFSIRYNYNQYCKHSVNFGQSKLIHFSGIKRWHQQKNFSVLIGNYFSTCYSYLDIMKNSGNINSHKNDIFMNLTREIRNFIIHREVLSITNNERSWIDDDGQFHFKSQILIPINNFIEYINCKTFRNKEEKILLLKYIENRFEKNLMLSDIIDELKDRMESIFIDYRSHFVIMNKEALMVLVAKYEEISKIINDADMSHYKAASIKYRYLRLLLFVYFK
jgi:hypothetical protein